MAWAWLEIKTNEKLLITSQSKRLQEEIDNTIMVLKHLGDSKKEAVAKIAKILKEKVDGYEKSGIISYGTTMCSFQHCFMSLMYEKIGSK